MRGGAQRMAKKNMKEQNAKTKNTTKNQDAQAKTDNGSETAEEIAESAAKSSVEETVKAAEETSETVKDSSSEAVEKTTAKGSSGEAAAKTAKSKSAKSSSKTAKGRSTKAAAKDAVAEETAETVKEETTKAAKDAVAEETAETVKEETAEAAKDAVAEETAKAAEGSSAADASSVEAFSEDDVEKMVKDAETKSSKEIKQERENLEKELKEQREEVKNQREEIKNREKAMKLMRQAESKQRRTEMKNSVVQKEVQFRESAKEMSADLRGLLTKEIASMKRIKKTRGAEIMAIFAKHNFYMGGFSPVELRTTLEDLGPTYVKIGQIMSSRADMLPESYCVELKKLRQNVKKLDPAIARAVIEQETGKKIDEIFKEFVDEPIGSASIGQAHGGTLLDGSKVVVKVQRPLIADMMRNDFVLLRKIASAVNTIKEGNDNDSEEQIDLLSAIDELEKVTNEELDFRIEAQNTIFFKEHCIQDETKISCPTIYPELTTERIMTMSFVDGYSVSKRDRLIADGYDPNEIGGAIVDNYLHQVLDVGTFHADPHQGNLMVSHGVPFWIDFGMIGRLTDHNIKLIQDLILAIIQTDTEALVNAGMAMGAASPKTDRAKLTADLDAMIGRYMSVTNLDELDTAALLGDVTDVLASNYIKIPGEYTMLIRSIATIEGVIEELCPELNLFKMITDKLLDRAKKSFDLQQTLIDAGKDAMSLSKKASKIPVLISDALNSVVKGRAKVNLELTGYQELMAQIKEMVKLAILALFSCVLFFGSCILCMTDIQPKTPSGMPMLAVAGFIFGIALAIYTIRRLVQKSK